MRSINQSEPVKITQGNRILAPEYDKLNKVERLLTKIENDVHRKVKDLDRNIIVDTLKKTYQLYQLILAEIHFQMSELRLDKYTSVIQKIFSGQNTLLDALLKLKVNSELNQDQFLESLQLLQRNKRLTRSQSVDKRDQPFDFGSPMQKISPGMSKMGLNQLKRQVVTINPVKEKKLSDKGTDTEEDRQDAKSSSKIIQKQLQLQEITKDLTDATDDVSEFLKNKQKMFTNTDASNAEKSLKQVLRDLSLKQKRAEELEAEGNSLLSREENFKSGIQNMENSLMNGLKDVAYKAKAAQEFQLRQNFKITRQQVEVSEQTTQTERDVLKERYEKLMNECKQKDKKFIELDKKYKDRLRDVEILENKIKSMNIRIEEYIFNERKREDEFRRLKKEKELSLTVQEKEKMKKYIEENIKLKLKMKELIEELKKLELDNVSNMDKFRKFIMNSNLSDDQKRLLLGKAEELFKSDIAKRFNFKEMEQLAKIDQDMLKDTLLKDIIGGDPIQFLKKIKAEVKTKAQERLNNPFYDSEFDPDLLEDGQKIVVRKVKKRIQRINSRGELVEEEIEVEEEVVLDKNGNEIRKREKPKSGIVTDPAILDFINKHGGLAIGGSKFILPQKPGRPVAKDGRQIKEGEWFIDEKGNKVKMMRNQNGEEEYEIEEKYVDENGVERTRTKKMKVKKDANGEEFTEESYVDPITGKQVNVVKKVIKDKDGNEIIEEIITDSSGNKIIKRTKVKKDKDGNDIIEEEIIDQYGNKQIIRTKKMKDENGNDIIVKEIINADGSKVIVTEKIDKNGNRIVIEDKIDKYGQQQQRIEKKIVIGADGKPIIEEIIYDEKGNKLIKKTKMLVDENGNVFQQEETTDQFGNKVIKNIKNIKDKDGNEYTQEETIDQFGNKVIKNIRSKVDQNGNQYIEEEIIGADGTKKIIKKRIDKDGNQIEEEEFIDENGNRIVVKKILNKDGTIIEERFNATTGEKVIVKKKIDESGREIIEETKIDANGNSTTVKKVVSKDKNGNTIIEETFIDPITGELITVKKKITKGKDGKDIIEEQIIDSKGNIKIIKKKIYKDAEGREVIEEEIIGADGKKYNVKKKVYKDADGNQVEEEEMIDEFGNKIIIKKKIGSDGKEIIEEIRISKDGKKTVIQKIISKDGTVEETIIDSTGKIIKRKHKLGTEDKQIQVDSLSSLKNVLLSLGCDSRRVDELVNQIMQYIQKGEAIIFGDEVSITNKMKQLGITIQQEDKNKNSKKSKEEEEEDIEEDKFDPLDGMTEEQQMELLFKKIMGKKGQYGDILRMIRNHVGKNGEQEVTIEDFKKYFKKFSEVHLKCGENCPHLRRFYERLGFTWLKYKRRYLKLKDTRIQAFNKPKDFTDPNLLPPLIKNTPTKPQTTDTSQLRKSLTKFSQKSMADAATDGQNWISEEKDLIKSQKPA